MIKGLAFILLGMIMYITIIPKYSRNNQICGISLNHISKGQNESNIAKYMHKDLFYYSL